MFDTTLAIIAMALQPFIMLGFILSMIHIPMILRRLDRLEEANRYMDSDISDIESYLDHMQVPHER